MSLSPAYAALPSRAVVGGAPGIPPDLRRCIRRAYVSLRNFLGALKRVQDFLSADLFPKVAEQTVGNLSDQDHSFVSIENIIAFHGQDTSRGRQICFALTQRHSANVPVQ